LKIATKYLHYGHTLSPPFLKRSHKKDLPFHLIEKDDWKANYLKAVKEIKNKEIAIHSEFLL